MTDSPKSSRNQIASLPPELINFTAVFAAQQEVYTNRAWFAQLALVGPEVFRTIRPILYSDLIITSHNVAEVSSIPSLRERILQYVRRITAVQLHRLGRSALNPTECLDAILREWQPQLESYIQVPWKSLKKLLARLSADNVDAVSGTQSQLTRLDLSSIAFDNLCADTSVGIPSSIAQNITHISRFVPPAWATVNLGDGLPTPRSWVHAIVDALPSLTYLGLVALKYPNGTMSHGYMGRWDNFADLGLAVRAMLDRRETLLVTLRIVGGYTVAPAVLVGRQCKLRAASAPAAHPLDR